MPTITIDGTAIAYDLLGDGPRTAVLTPGGRFSKDTPGVRELAERLAHGGLRVLIWDRPNCGESDLCFRGASESLLHADALAGLLRGLGVPRAMLVGGSAGSRVSLLAAIRHPEVVDRLFLLWISGGAVSLAALAFHYCHDSLAAAAAGGMEAVAALPGWQEQLNRNPRNRAALLRQDGAAFIETMKRWAWSFFPQENSPVPGLVPAQLAALQMPVMVLRSGESDYHHPRETSEAVHAMIAQSRIAEPPWGDREWIERLQAASHGEGLFARWPLLAPQILEFARTS
ncbi:MAG TPA: alpha/beta hydrolase [Steroidobacteraceae bacterium]|nr:alpha/beta hydrolase [Steroidobacteraceae bacterium]